MSNRKQVRNPYRSTYRNMMDIAAGGAIAYGKSAIGRYRKLNSKAVAKKVVRNIKKSKKVKREVYKSLRKLNRVSKIQKQVKTLQRASKASMGNLIYRITTSAVQIVSANTQGNETLFVNHIAELETVLAQLRYYNPSSPATLLTADGTTGSYSKDFYFKPSYMRLSVRNNYQVPCIVRAYVLRIKTDTSQSPETAWASGLTDVSSSLTPNMIGTYPSDSPQIEDFWAIESQNTYYLDAGKEFRFSTSCKPFHYDPSIFDTHGLAYQVDCDTRAMMVSVQGVIAHDSALSQQGRSGAGVDIDVYKVYSVEYEAGASIKFIYLDNSYTSFTNGALVCNKAVADNQGYSLS